MPAGDSPQAIGSKARHDAPRKRKENGTDVVKVKKQPGAKAETGAGLSEGAQDAGFTTRQALPALLDLQVALALVIGGCCSNVWTYEELLRLNPKIGSALTFSQMIFIALYRLPSFLHRDPKTSSWIPSLRPRQVPLTQWATQVVLFSSGSLLMNWVYAYDVPLSLMIVFRSAGLVISMILGRLLLRKQYTLSQVLCVLVVTSGVTLASLSRATPGKNTSSGGASTFESGYITGILLLVLSSFCTGLLGVLQEKTYKKYGPCWQEGVFYTHVLSLPIFLFLAKDVKQGLDSLSRATSATSTALGPYTFLIINLLSQLVCVSGVNKLSSQVSSVSTNLVLTTRKALSLCFSVWWFGNSWNGSLVLGALMVFAGSFLFGFVGSKPAATKSSPGEEKTKRA